MRNKTSGTVTFITLALAVVIVLAMGQCAPGPDKAVATLKTMGFKDIAITGSHPYMPSWYGCSSGDGVAHGATATNQSGERVAVIVCCGTVLKGCTVRTP